MNFQMFKLDLEKAEEQEIKLPTSVGSSKEQEISRKTPSSVLLTRPKPLTVWITTKLWKIIRNGNTRLPNLPPEKHVCTSGSNSQNMTWNNRQVPNRLTNLFLCNPPDWTKGSLHRGTGQYLIHPEWCHHPF